MDSGGARMVETSVRQEPSRSNAGTSRVHMQTEMPNAKALGIFILATRRGNALLEYFTLAMVAVVVTIAFYQTSLSDENAGVRASIRDAFLAVCQDIAGATCQ